MSREVDEPGFFLTIVHLSQNLLFSSRAYCCRVYFSFVVFFPEGWRCRDGVGEFTAFLFFFFFLFSSNSSGLVEHLSVRLCGGRRARLGVGSVEGGMGVVDR